VSSSIPGWLGLGKPGSYDMLHAPGFFGLFWNHQTPSNNIKQHQTTINITQKKKLANLLGSTNSAK
jgi:hypothetical protein